MGVATSTDLLTLGQAAALLPNRPNAKCLHRWITEGVKCRKTGARVHLKHVRVGGRLFTTSEFVEAFQESLNATPDTSPTIVSPAARNRADTAAALSLARKGYVK